MGDNSTMDNISLSHAEHVAELLYEMMKTKNHSDVTLVCDDNRKIQAHKSVLSACSDVFRRIFIDINPYDSTILLSDIQHQEMESILKFMYLGVTSFSQKRMKYFFNVAKNLEIKAILNSMKFEKSKQTQSDDDSNDTDQLESETFLDDEKGDNDEYSKEEDGTETCERQQNKSANTEDLSSTNIGDLSMSKAKENDENSKTFRADNTLKILCDYMDIQVQNNLFGDNSKEETTLAKEKGIKYACNQCDYQVKKQRSLKKHIELKHLGIKKNVCDQCGFSSLQEQTLRNHIQSEHLGVRLNCGFCDYQAKRIDGLKDHILTKHEGFTYQCDQCDLGFAQKKTLKQHIETKHEGKRYMCNQCEYTATRMKYVQRHIERKHEGLVFTCEQCDYTAVDKRSVRTHIQSVHNTKE